MHLLKRLAFLLAVPASTEVRLDSLELPVSYCPNATQVQCTQTKHRGQPALSPFGAQSSKPTGWIPPQTGNLPFAKPAPLP